jgi:cyclopropane-fatty-acyl-phospholipid synthase
MNQPLSITIAESPWLPDRIARAGIRNLCQKRLKQEFVDDVEQASKRFQQVLDDLRSSKLAIETERANEQHYELPTAFFQAVLGPRLKYSGSFFAEGDDLAAAENRSLQIYSERAKLSDGLQILELGCGWGSFTLWMAEQYPNAKITAVSNSHSQRVHIMGQAEAKGFRNVTVITQDVNQLTFAEGNIFFVIAFYNILLKSKKKMIGCRLTSLLAV